MEAVLAVIAFVQLVVLVMFFQLVGDVEKIRLRFISRKPQYWLNEYTKSSYLRREDKALYCLQEFIWCSIQKDKSKAYFNELKDKYEARFKTLHSDFPIYPF